MTATTVASTQDDVRKAKIKARRRADARFRFLGLMAVITALSLLFILVGTIVRTGYTAFSQTMLTMEVYFDPDRIDPEKPRRGRYRNILQDKMSELFPEVTGAKNLRALRKIPSAGAQQLLRDMVANDLSLIGTTKKIQIPVSDPFDQLHKGVIPRSIAENKRRVSDQQIVWFDELVERGFITKPFNRALFFNADSRFPELAGLRGAITGSFYSILVCFLISFPVGISAAIYLEEFAPKSRWVDLIEVNINNLAAVPSIVFGLLGLAVFLNFMGLPRSAPLVGGMVLALMTLPTIIVAARASLKAVPPSIREAALGVGASKHQTVIDHVLPLAMPGILTGTIIGLAQALGETAPLLLIGMNAFITAAPDSILEPSTAMPTQIFIWFDSPERGFVARTSAAILVLLGFLVVMNIGAIFLRQRFEKKW